MVCVFAVVSVRTTAMFPAAAAQAKATEMPAAGHIAARCVFGLVETDVGDFGDFGADDGA